MAVLHAVQISTPAELYDGNAITLHTSAIAAARNPAGSVDKNLHTNIHECADQVWTSTFIMQQF